jgi:hypothetical protein
MLVGFNLNPERPAAWLSSRAVSDDRALSAIYRQGQDKV